MRKFLVYFCAFASLNINLLANHHCTLEDLASGWNQPSLVKAYFHNSELQRQWAWELMGKLPLRGDEQILDLGCGDGKISAETCRLVPGGKVTGVDISSEMIGFAKVRFPTWAYSNLEFRHGQSLTFENVAAEDTPFKDPSIPTMRTLSGCSAFLEEAGYDIKSLEMVDTENPFCDKAELVVWMVGTVTANWNVPPEQSPAFFNDVVERMCELDPTMVDEQGHIRFKFSRIYAVATPKGC